VVLARCDQLTLYLEQTMGRMTGFCLALVMLVAPSAFSQDRDELRDAVVEVPVAPETVADSVIEFTPSRDAALNIPLAQEQNLEGRMVLQAGTAPTSIIVPAHTMILPLQQGVPVRMFLMRFEDRDAYYPIAIFPL
jgi:hypothetical protein